MSTALGEGTIFADRYEVVRCIATGGMGAVYEVLHIETRRHRALKVMHAQSLQSEDLRTRFRQEAHVAANIDSEHIVDVFDAGIDGATGMPFLVMELLRGEDLGQRLRRVQRLAPAEVLPYLHQTALALDKTHRAYIVHRDLKPDNLFLCERDEGPPKIKVLDFGIAKLIAEGSTQANATNSIGTPLYMAPEQFRPGASVSPATDIFALGMIAYKLLVGKSYWIDEAKAGDNVFVFASTAAAGPQEPATARAQRQDVTLPPAFDSWFARATALSPADRFPSASTAVRALADALGLPYSGADAYGTAQEGVPSSVELRSQIIPPPASSATPLASGLTAAPVRRRQRLLVVAGTIIVATVVIVGMVSATLRIGSATPSAAVAPSAPTVAPAPTVVSTGLTPGSSTPVVAPITDVSSLASASPPAELQRTAVPSSAPSVSAVAPLVGLPPVARPATQPSATATTKKTGQEKSLYIRD